MVGEVGRLWLFIYCYTDIKLMQKKKKKKKTKLIRLALSYSYHLPKVLVSEKCYLLNESEQLGSLYCVMFSLCI